MGRVGRVLPLGLELDHLLEEGRRASVLFHLVGEDRHVEGHRVVVLRFREPAEVLLVHEERQLLRVLLERLLGLPVVVGTDDPEQVLELLHLFALELGGEALEIFRQLLGHRGDLALRPLLVARLEGVVDDGPLILEHAIVVADLAYQRLIEPVGRPVIRVRGVDVPELLAQLDIDLGRDLLEEADRLVRGADEGIGPNHVVLGLGAQVDRGSEARLLRGTGPLDRLVELVEGLRLVAQIEPTPTGFVDAVAEHARLSELLDLSEEQQRLLEVVLREEIITDVQIGIGDELAGRALEHQLAVVLVAPIPLPHQRQVVAQRVEDLVQILEVRVVPLDATVGLDRLPPPFVLLAGQPLLLSAQPTQLRRVLGLLGIVDGPQELIGLTGVEEVLALLPVLVSQLDEHLGVLGAVLGFDVEHLLEGLDRCLALGGYRRLALASSRVEPESRPVGPRLLLLFARLVLEHPDAGEVGRRVLLLLLLLRRLGLGGRYADGRRGGDDEGKTER